MQYQIPKPLYESIRSHYLNGDFNSINVTFYHLGCEILYSKIEAEHVKEFTPSKDLHFLMFTFFNEQITENCHLALYTDENGDFKIGLTLIIQHKKNYFELDHVIDSVILAWISNYAGETVNIDQVSASLILFGSSDEGACINESSFRIFIKIANSEIEIDTEQIELHIKERIAENIENLAKSIFGEYSSKYSFSISIDEDATLTIIEDCYMGELIVSE